MRVTHKKYSEDPPSDNDFLVGGPDWNDEHQIDGPYIAGVVQFDAYGNLLVVGGARGAMRGEGRFVVFLDSDEPISEMDSVINVSVSGEKLYSHWLSGVDEITGNPIIQIVEWSFDNTAWMPTSNFSTATVQVILGVRPGMN